MIHSLCVPCVGFKLDAIPGRLSGSSLVLSSPGVAFGYCTELCGGLHSFMPIKFVLL